MVDPQSANADSPDMGYGEVAAQYPQEVMLMFNLLKRTFPDDVAIGLIHADHTKAFMKVALHWLYTGQFTFMFNKRFFVLRVTPFGFKWATHTFSPFPMAIQQKAIADFRRHLLVCSELSHMTDAKKAFIVQAWLGIFNYCDDYLGATPMLGSLPAYLTTFIYEAGLAIMGQGCWSARKALEDGFFASSQCFIGIVFDAINDTVRVDVSMWIKLRDMLLTVTPATTSYTLGFAQRIFGVLIWIIQVHSTWRPYVNCWVRMMNGVSTADASPSTIVFPGLPGEDTTVSCMKCYRDAQVLLQAANAVIETDGAFGAVKMSCFNRDVLPSSMQAASVSMDASTKTISFCWVEGRRIVSIDILPEQRVLLRKVLEADGVTATEERMTIAIFEFIAVTMAQFQFGQRRKALGITTVFYYIDNQNACTWLTKGFAGSAIGQDLCRVVAANEFAYANKGFSIWTPTEVNKINDTRTRLEKSDGSVDYAAVEYLAYLQSQLDEPYVDEAPCSEVVSLLQHVSGLEHC